MAAVDEESQDAEVARQACEQERASSRGIVGRGIARPQEQAVSHVVREGVIEGENDEKEDAEFESVEDDKRLPLSSPLRRKELD